MEKVKSMNINFDEFKFVFKFRNQALENGANREFYEQFITDFEDRLFLKYHLGEKELCNNVNGYTTTYRYGCIGDLYLIMAYNESRPDMGILIEWKAKGLDKYCSERLENGVEYYKFQLFQDIVVDLKYESIGYYRVRRLDIAADFLNYQRETVSAFYDRIRRKKLFTYRVSRKTGKLVRTRLSLKPFLEDVPDEDGFRSRVETLYVGNRSGECFIRFYNKKKQLEDTGASYELTKDIESYLRIEQELKYKDEPSFELISQVLELKTENDFVVWAYKTFLDNFILADENQNFAKLFEKMRLVADGSVHGTIRHNVKRRYSYERSKEWFANDKAGFVGLMYKIKELEGQQGLKNYMMALGEKMESYSPSENTADLIQKERELKLKRLQYGSIKRI